MWSSLTSALCLLVCTGVLGKWRALSGYSISDILRLIALGSLGAFGYYALLYWAYAPCGASCGRTQPVLIIAQYTWPAFAVLWSSVLLGETLTRRVIASMLLGLVAVALAAVSAAATTPIWTALPVVMFAAVIFGLYTALLKRTNYEPFSSLAVGFCAAAVFAFGEVLWLSDRIRLPQGDDLAAVLVNGLLVNGLSYVCWYRALRTAPISAVAPCVAFTPVLAAVWATNGVSSAVSSAQWAGLALVLVSVFIANGPSRPSRLPRANTPRAARRLFTTDAATGSPPFSGPSP